MKKLRQLSRDLKAKKLTDAIFASRKLVHKKVAAAAAAVVAAAAAAAVVAAATVVAEAEAVVGKQRLFVSFIS